MFEELTMSQLRSQIEQHLMMVEEVLGGMDTFIQRLEKRVSRIEEGLGLEPEGISASGWVADLQRGACPNFCVNGVEIRSGRYGPRTGW